MGKIIKGYWDCQYCGEKGIDGGLRDCTACGHQRDDSVTFYMKSETEYVSEEEAAKAGKNPDWLCSFCHVLNSDGVAVCKGCGASREDSEKNYFDVQQDKKEKEETEARAAEASGLNSGTKQQAKRPKWLLIALLVLVGVLVFTLMPKTHDYTVADFDWARSIRVQEEREVQQEGWSLPRDATLVSQKRAIQGYRQVLDHYEDVEVTRYRRVQRGYDTWTTQEDMGNGYFREVEHSTPHYETEPYTETESRPVYRNEPVYGTYYTYMIWQWFDNRTVDTSGKDHEPYWGEPDLREHEREYERREVYRVAVDNKGKTTVYTLDEELWKTLNKGDGVTIRQHAGGTADLLDGSGKAIGTMRAQ